MKSGFDFCYYSGFGGLVTVGLEDEPARSEYQTAVVVIQYAFSFWRS